MAIAVSREQVLIALIIHLKEYFSAYLDLKEALFEGFQEGCTVLYFAITTTDAVLLAPRVLSHLAELKTRFSVTHIIVFGHFVADVDRGTIEPLAAHDRRQVVAVFEKVQQELISTKKKLDVVEEGFVEAEKMLRTSTVSWSEDKFNATPLGTEPVLQIKDLKEEILHQFEQLQTSKVNEDVMKYEHLRNESIALKMKLKEEEMLRKKAEEEQRRIAGELVKMEKKCSESGSKSNILFKKVISDVEGLLGQSSESVEGLQDKIRILVEEWSKLSEHERSLQLSGGGTTECEDELFALAYEDGVKDKYMCHVYEKTERHRTYHESTPTWMDTTAKLHMVITYSTSHWSQIVKKYCKPDGHYWELRTVIQDFTVEGDVITVNMSENSGPTWSCTFDGISKVPTSSLDFTKRFPPEKDGPKSLEQAVKSSVYPPKITLIASSDVHPRTEYNRSRLICLELAGSSLGIQIPVKIMDRVEPEMREPEKVSEPESDRKTHEEEFSFEVDVLSPSMKKRMLPSPSVRESGMTKAPLKTKASTILLASSKEKDQQAN